MTTEDRRLLAEDLVDAIGEKLQVDTGTLQEDIFADAVETAEKFLAGLETGEFA